MIDFIRATANKCPVEAWENNTLLDFKFKVSEKTGLLSTTKTATLLKAKHKALFNFEISYFQDTPKCSIEGSLHKFKNRAGINYDRFTFAELIQVVNDLQNYFSIDPKQTLLRSFEFGVNLCLKYPPERIIKAAIFHKGKHPQQINKYNRKLGVQFVHDNYIIKLYDKSKQCGFKGQHILRVEIRVKRLIYIKKYHIKTLHDLIIKEKIHPLITELIKVVNEILFFDYSAKTDLLTLSELNKWNRFNNPNYWESLSKSQAYKARQLFKKLSNKIEAKDYNKQLTTWIKYEWFELFKESPGDLFTKNINTAVEANQKGDLFTNVSEQNEYEKRRPFHNAFDTPQETKKATFSHFKCSVNALPPGNVKTIPLQPELFTPDQVPTNRRYCRTCGRDISHQKNGSVYCSEKYYGKVGKACRNVEANKQRRIKRGKLNEQKRAKKIQKPRKN